jgi:hypothetical protein
VPGIEKCAGEYVQLLYALQELSHLNKLKKYFILPLLKAKT